MAKRPKFGYFLSKTRPEYSGNDLLQRMSVTVVRTNTEYSSDEKELFSVKHIAFPYFDFKGFGSGRLEVYWNQDTFIDWHHAQKVLGKLWQRFAYYFSYRCYSPTVDENGNDTYCYAYGHSYDTTYEQWAAKVCPVCGGSEVKWERDRWDSARLPGPEDIVNALESIGIYRVHYAGNGRYEWDETPLYDDTFLSQFQLDED